MEVEWYKPNGAAMNGRLPIVTKQPGYAWNKTNRYEFLSKVYTQNVVFWPWHNKNELACIYRDSRTHLHDR